VQAFHHGVMRAHRLGGDHALDRVTWLEGPQRRDGREGLGFAAGVLVGPRWGCRQASSDRSCASLKVSTRVPPSWKLRAAGRKPRSYAARLVPSKCRIPSFVPPLA
jgi:hypothetical protein